MAMVDVDGIAANYRRLSPSRLVVQSARQRHPGDVNETMDVIPPF